MNKLAPALYIVTALAGISIDAAAHADKVGSCRNTARNLCSEYPAEYADTHEEFCKKAKLEWSNEPCAKTEANGRCDVFSSVDNTLQRSTYDFGGDNAKTAQADCEASKHSKYIVLKGTGAKSKGK